jgi:hypothetical protein
VALRSSSLFLALALAGCPKKPSGPAASEATCDQVGAALDAALAADLAASGATAEPDAATINRAVVQAVVESCTRDGWSAAARTCFHEARAEASEKCHAEFTETQVQALDDRMDSAVAKAAPAACSELEPLITEQLTAELAEMPADQRAGLEPKVAPFAAAVGAQCAAGWSVEARTCVRDASKARADAGRCARWLDDPQRKAYQEAVEAAFGAPPPAATAPP